MVNRADSEGGLGNRRGVCDGTEPRRWPICKAAGTW